MRPLTDFGLWKTDEIKVKFINEDIVWVDYEKYEVNAQVHRDVVRLKYMDRLKGMTLEDKIALHLLNLKMKLENKNKQIRKFKDLEAKFNR